MAKDIQKPPYIVNAAREDQPRHNFSHHRRTVRVIAPRANCGDGDGEREGGRQGERHAPVAENVLRTAKAHMPATNCASPPTKRAMPMTTFGVVTPRAWTLYMDRMNVVDAKPYNPLRPHQPFRSVHRRPISAATHSGPGSPSWR